MNWYIKQFNELNIRELYNILKIRSEVFVVEQNCPYLDVDTKDEESYHLYAIKDNTIVAYSRILKKGLSYDEASIGRVLVKKEYRGKGISRELLLKSIEFIINDMKEDRIKISAQAYLIDFYKSVGFNEVSDIYLEDDIPHIEMLYIK